MKLSKTVAVSLFKAIKYPTAGDWSVAQLLAKIKNIHKLIKPGTKIKDPDLNETLKKAVKVANSGGDFQIEDKGSAKAGKTEKVTSEKKTTKAGGKAAPKDDEDEDEDEDEEDSDDEEDEEDEDADEEDESDEDSDDESDDDEDTDSDEDESEEEDDEDESEEDDDEDTDSDEDESEEEDDEDESEEDEDEDSDDEDEDEEEEEVADEKPKKPGKPAGKKAGTKPPTKAKSGDGNGVIATIVELLKGATKDEPLGKKAIHKKLCAKFKDRSADSMWTTVNIQVPSRLNAEKKLDVRKNEKGYWIPKGAAKATKPAKEEVKTTVKKKVKAGK